MPVISPLVHIPSHHTSMVPCIEAYTAQDSTQYRSSDFHISTDSPPGLGLSIRSPALVLYSVPPTQERSWPSWPNCTEYRYLRQAPGCLRIAIDAITDEKGCQLGHITCDPRT
jgi:hypothetical protein